MARISGFDLPNSKRVEIGLTYIFGIGRTTSNKILADTGIDPNTRVKDLTEDEVNKLRTIIDNEYSVEGEKVPSVSEILAPLSADRYGAINPIVLQEAARRGRIVHELCEAVDYGLDLGEDEEAMEFAPYVDAYYAFLLEHEVDWHMSEEIVFKSRYIEEKVPLYAGTIDRYGMVDGELAVVDIKTYSSLGTDEQMGASCQTALYRDALISMGEAEDPRYGAINPTVLQTEGDYDGAIKRYVLHLKKDSKYRLADLGKFDLERGWNSGAVAWELYHLWAHKQEVYKSGRKRKA